MAYTILPSLSPNKVLTASYMNELNDNLRVFSRHNHSASLGEGAAIIRSASAASGLTYRYEAQAHIAPSQTNWSTSTGANSFIFGGKMGKAAGVAASLKFPVGLYSGLYSLWVMFDDSQPAAAGGSMRILLEGASVASIDVLNTAEQNAVCKIDGIRVNLSASTVLEFTSDANGDAVSISSWKIKRTGS